MTKFGPKFKAHREGMPVEDRIANLSATTLMFMKQDGLEVYACVDCKSLRIAKVGTARCQRCLKAVTMNAQFARRAG